jgi:hypothetical protein
VPEVALGAVRETLREHGEPVSAGAMTFMQARTANEVLKAQQKLSKGALKLVSQVEPGAVSAAPPCGKGARWRARARA